MKEKNVREELAKYLRYMFEKPDMEMDFTVQARWVGCQARLSQKQYYPKEPYCEMTVKNNEISFTFQNVSE